MGSGRFFRWADAIVVIISSTLVAGYQSQWFDWFWESPQVKLYWWLPVLLTVVAAFFGAFRPFSSYLRIKRRPVHDIWNHYLLHSLGSLIVKCQEITDKSSGLEFAPTDIALHVWKVGWGFERRWPFFQNRLVRVRTVRLGSVPALRPITFYKGKGIVGRCWQENDEIISDNYKRYRRVKCRDDWMSLPPAEHDNMKYEEFLRSRDRGAILASPIRNRSQRFVGCISVDVKRGVGLLHNDAVRSIVQSLCIGMAGVKFEDIE